MRKKIGILCLFVLFGHFASNAQSLPVGTPGLEELIRNMQLQGKLDANLSFSIRPLHKSVSFNEDSLLKLTDSDLKLKPIRFTFLKKFGRFQVLPITVSQKFNSHHPYGWNDAGMIPAKGFQSQLSAGFYAGLGPISVQIKPEIITASNSNYENNSLWGSPTEKGYKKILMGQSSLRLNSKSVSFGISTENLWWGPGQYSSLLMSNNAPGFEHFTFNTVRPLKTPIGKFEWQLITAKLKDDTSQAVFENYNLKPAAYLKDWVFMNSLVLIYQPRFMPNCFLGFTRTFLKNSEKMGTGTIGFIDNYLPVFTSPFKKGNPSEDIKGRDQLVSLFMRYLFPKSHAEFYWEYGWNDHKYNLRDLTLDVQHAAAYIVGFKKLHPLVKDTWVDFGMEFTHMSQSTDYIVRNAGNWYVHGQELQGYTNRNQIMGAGSGYGNNVQTISTNWCKKMTKVGLKFQRIQHDPKGHTGQLNVLGMRAVQWNDIAIGLNGQYYYKRFLLNAELQSVHSKNYIWEQDNNKKNFYMLLNLSYLL